jgi:hypothetical protein
LKRKLDLLFTIEILRFDRHMPRETVRDKLNDFFLAEHNRQKKIKLWLTISLYYLADLLSHDNANLLPVSF